MGRLVAAALVVVVAACTTSTRAPGARLTPVGARLTDEAMASDLATFHALGERVERASQGASGTRLYLAQRATEWIALAREAYERNDRSAFPEDLIVLAERDLEALEGGPGATMNTVASNVLFPNDVRLFDDMNWGRALALRSEADRVGAPAEIARAEAMLLRQGNRILAGPACLEDDEVSRRVGEALSAIERSRVNPVRAQPVDTLVRPREK